MDWKFQQNEGSAFKCTRLGKKIIVLKVSMIMQFRREITIRAFSWDDVNAKLKEFEGVDVNDLRGQITKLQGDLKAKDDEYAAKEADRVFMDSIKEAVKTAGGRNEKAVIAMLDIDALKESKNQSADIKKALEDVKKSDGYLFGANEPINNVVGGTGGNGGEDIGGDEMFLLFVLLWDCPHRNKKRGNKIWQTQLH